MNEVSLCINAVEVLPTTRQVRVAGVRVPLGDRAFDLLAFLLLHRDRVVGKDELLQAVWPGREVEDGNLHVHVSALRRLLGAAAIVTVHGRGYRLAAPVHRATDAPVPLAPAPSAARLHPEPTLIGRDDALSGLLQRLQPGRWVTLSGPGGVGKTRLAQAASAAYAQAAGTGKAAPGWVDLSTLHNADGLIGHVAQALDLPGGHGGLGDAHALAMRLSTTQTLLVLDNAEHLRSAVGELVAALQKTAPGLCGLVTSREPLRLHTEQLWPLAGLAVPERADDPNAADCAAVALFAARAAAADGQFVLTPDTLPWVVDLCRALDGLPLALELAAARLPLLGLEGLVQNLGQRLHAFTHTHPARPQRHHSLHNVLAWSWQLLDGDEQALLRRLSWLSGRFDMAMVKAVSGQAAGCSAEQPWRVVASFESLCRKHLVAPHLAQPQRWHLLETTRQFAMAKLLAAGECDATALAITRALAAQFRQLHEAWLHGTLPETQIDTQAGERLDDLCGALDWVCKQPDQLALAAGLMADGARTLSLHGLQQRARGWATAAHAAANQLSPALQLQLKGAWVWVRPAALDSPATLAPVLMQAAKDVEQAQPSADGRRRAFQLAAAAAQAARRVGDVTGAAQHLAHASSLLVATDPPRLQARLLDLQQSLFDYNGAGSPVASARIEELLDDLRAAGDAASRGAFLLRIGLGERLLLQGQPAAARQWLRAVCEDVNRTGRWSQRALLAPFDTLAAAELACGDGDAAAEPLRLALDSAARADLWSEAASVLAWYLAVQGRHRAAAELMGALQMHVLQRGLHVDAMQQLALREAHAAMQHSGCSAPEMQRWTEQGKAQGQDPARPGLRHWLAPPHPRFAP